MPDGTGEGFDSPVLDMGQVGEFEFWAAVSGITGGPKRPPVPPKINRHSISEPFDSSPAA